MFKHIIDRRTVRKYKNSPISETILQQILKAGMYAPYASKDMPFHFIVCKNKDILKDLWNIHPFGKPLETAPVAVVVCTDKKEEVINGLTVSDCAAATQNMLLAAQSFGIGSCWLGLYPWTEISSKVEKYFDMPEKTGAFAIVTFGYSDEESEERPDRFDSSRIHIDGWK